MSRYLGDASDLAQGVKTTEHGDTPMAEIFIHYIRRKLFERHQFFPVVQLHTGSSNKSQGLGE